MITLRNFTENDILQLRKNKYHKLSTEEIRKLICDWNSKMYEEKYFEMFAIIRGKEIVGTISLYEQSKSVVSCGIEIFEAYRGKGYSQEALSYGLEISKRKGYKIATSQIRVDNFASIALHKKLAFELSHEYVNRKGNSVYFYMKPLV